MCARMCVYRMCGHVHMFEQGAVQWMELSFLRKTCGPRAGTGGLCYDLWDPTWRDQVQGRAGDSCPTLCSMYLRDTWCKGWCGRYRWSGCGCCCSGSWGNGEGAVGGWSDSFRFTEGRTSSPAAPLRWGLPWGLRSRLLPRRPCQGEDTCSSSLPVLPRPAPPASWSPCWAIPEVAPAVSSCPTTTPHHLGGLQ